MTRKFMMLGCDQKLNENINHSFELVYNWTKDYKGFQGLPADIRGGVEYNLSDQTEVTSAFVFADTCSVSMDV